MKQTSKQKQPHLLVGSTPGFIQALLTLLSDSEWHLIEFMVAENKWQPPAAPVPPDYLLHGSIESGIFLFLLNNPTSVTDPDAQLIMDALQIILHFYQLPASNITVSQYNQLASSQAIYVDGTVVATSLYTLYDQKWIIALYNLILTVTESRMYDSYLPVPAIPYSPIVLQPRVPNRLTIGMLGDWGAGNSQAAGTLSNLVSFVPDYLIHLGDVYYSGTPSTSPSPKYALLNEENANFVNLWPSGWTGKSFTLNSNHEMYSGANALFSDALLPSTSPFSAQRQYSMFALNVGDWTILGLDSAYNSDPFGLFMQGALDLPPDVPTPSGYVTQTQWVKSLKLNPGKTIVLTHHNGFDFNCDTATQSYYNNFWGEVQGALGADPYAWYWGHIHNGIVYANPVKIAASTTFTTNTYCRCLGNGSLPYGVSTELATSPSNIEWFAGQGNSTKGEISNGFVTLVFDLNNQLVQGITENFYLTSSPAIAAYSKLIYSNG